MSNLKPKFDDNNETSSPTKTKKSDSQNLNAQNRKRSMYKDTNKIITNEFEFFETEDEQFNHEHNTHVKSAIKLTDENEELANELVWNIKVKLFHKT